MKHILLAVFMAGMQGALVASRWDENEEKRADAIRWLDTKLAGMSVTPGTLRSLAATVFIGNFGPAFVMTLPIWLDMMASGNDKLIRLLS